jgi:integrase
VPNIETRQRRDGPRYVVRVRHPDPPPGRSGYTSATFATHEEATRFRADCKDRGIVWALAEYHRGEGNGGITLDQWARKHFDALTAPSGATVRRYRTVYAHSWAPTLGNLPLAQITRSHVATALNAVGGSDKTRQNKWAVLTHMFKTAIQEGLIPRSPCVGIKLGRRTDHERTEMRFLSIAEFSRVLLATPPHWRPLVMFLGGTGVRWGEAAALTVGDLDLDAAQPIVRVTKAEKADPEHPGRVVVGPTKSGKGRRTITLPPAVVDVLRPLVEQSQHKTQRPATARVFLPPNGGPLRHRTFYRDIWLGKILPGAGLTGVRLHDLRHSHVAWLIGDRVPLPAIQARLGHEKITTTIDGYGHLLPDLQRAAAEAAENVFAAIELPAAPLELPGQATR